MDIRALRTVQSKVVKSSEFNASGAENWGLLIDKFGKEQKTTKEEENKEPWFKNILLAPSASLQELYGAAYHRRKLSIGGTQEAVQALGRTVVGLGAQTTHEVGLTLQRTYGTPIIPGTALKGLASHYCHEVWGQADDQFKVDGEHYGAIFGRTDNKGYIIFEDAWIVPETLSQSLHDDVMTVHHPKYYQGANQSSGAEQYPPSDFDDPTPLFFLSVTGNFLLNVVCPYDHPQTKKWEQLAMQLLIEGLENWGIGGKTNSGYGRFRRLDAVGNAIVEPPKTAYTYGDKVQVRRIDDPKGKRTFWFEDTNGIGHGSVLNEGTPIYVPLGGHIELIVYSADKKGAFTLLWPDSPRLTPSRGKPIRNSSKRR